MSGLFQSRKDMYIPSLVNFPSSMLVQVMAVRKVFRAFDTIKGAQTRQVFRGSGTLVLREMAGGFEVGLDLIKIA